MQLSQEEAQLEGDDSATLILEKSPNLTDIRYFDAFPPWLNYPMTALATPRKCDAQRAINQKVTSFLGAPCTYVLYVVYRLCHLLRRLTSDVWLGRGGLSSVSRVAPWERVQCQIFFRRASPELSNVALSTATSSYWGRCAFEWEPHYWNVLLQQHNRRCKCIHRTLSSTQETCARAVMNLPLHERRS